MPTILSEPPPKPYYQDDLVTLYHGDCLEIIEWTHADVLVSDVPYGMALHSGWNGEFSNLEVAGDVDTSVRDSALALWGDLRPAVVFGRWSVPKPAGTKAVLTWDKGEHVGMGNLELPWKPNTEEIYVLGKWPKRTVGPGGSVLSFLAPMPGKSQGRFHPTEKPVVLMAELLASVPHGVIADPFAGSGSTLVAAKLLHRSAIGVELDESHCETAARRLSQEAFDFEAIA